MQFSDLRARAAFLASVGGARDFTPGPDWSGLVNVALADFSWQTEFNEEQITFTTVINQPEYTLPQPWFKAVKEMAYGTAVRLTRSTELEERLRDPLWFARPPSAQPARYLTPRPNVVRLVDSPAVAGDTVTVRGTRLAPPLVYDTDAPAFPDAWHEALALHAAVRYCEPFAAGADAPRLDGWRRDYARMVEECRTYLAGQRYGGNLRRQVQRGYRGRVPLIGWGAP